ncbi:Uncharacterised protein [Metamycoplasma arthritidis]|uniref:Transmembrane protein n=1 Tax=Metamycoplasma arthritidis (strain 158L3-1) TaxID=243272 RepID=B3PM72_META1|nr:hypothetical protein [Metamycoplasma arthritidis]ACF07124.1 hypothetical protein MARTH_orf205 [Metamycoplasma arthritidis 158L3-1]VEU78650.1 Uncharacterised protein [Metamycoplasma arthritidis]
MTNSSILSPQTKLILAITGLISLVIAIGGLVFTLIYKKKVLAKYRNYDEEVELEKLKIKNPNYGVILNDLKVQYRYPVPDFLVAFLTNTIYLNNYETVFVEDNADYLATSLALMASQINLALKELENFESKRACLQDQTKDLAITTTNAPLNKYDFIISFKQDQSLESLIEFYLPHLALQGMLILFFNKIKEIKALNSYLKKVSLRYETINFGQKNAILLAKDLKTEIAKN